MRARFCMMTLSLKSETWDREGAVFNTKTLAFVIQLGDFIDRDVASFEAPSFYRSPSPS